VPPTNPRRAPGARKRRNDDMPPTNAKRRDDLYLDIERVPFLGHVKTSINNKSVAMYLTIAGFTAFSFWHDYHSTKDMQRAIKAQEITTCVLTLNEAERRDFRTSGRYCGPAEWRLDRQANMTMGAL
jgi:hypothetical protein